MRIATVRLKSATPYSQSRMHDTPKLTKERPDDYEQRTWREKCTTDAEGKIIIPQMALKMALDRCSKMLGEQIPGKGKSTYTKHFLAGVQCMNELNTGVHKDEAPSITINANSDGVRGSGKRVKRIFPQIDHWEGEVSFAVLDETITNEVFERHITEAGKFVGIGRFRPENGGTNGRFYVESVTWNS